MCDFAHLVIRVLAFLQKKAEPEKCSFVAASPTDGLTPIRKREAAAVAAQGKAVKASTTTKDCSIRANSQVGDQIH